MSTTTHTPFFRANGEGQDLFAVQAGIPVGDAINCATALLEGAIDILRGIETSEGNAVAVLLKMAKAAIESARLGT